MPVILFTVMLTRPRGGSAQGQRPPLLPWFVVAFAVLVAMNSGGLLPDTVAGRQQSFAVVPGGAIAAIGMKTQLSEFVDVGLKPVVLMVGETIFFVTLVLAMVRWGA